MENTKNKSNENHINIIAQYTGSRAISVKNFIAANNLDATKLANALSNDQKMERKNFASAIAGRARIEYLDQLITKYSLNENREPLDFWHSKYGQTIFDMNKDNKFDRDLVRQYFLSLISTNAPKWRHELNRIAMAININPQEFELYTEQIDAMVERLEAEFDIYIATPCLTKGKINEVIDKVLGVHFDQEIQNTLNPRRYIITVAQFQTLLPQIIKSRKAKYNI